MPVLTWRDADNLPYHQLVCDGCGSVFACNDDSCYDWRLLRDAALFTGWATHPDPDHPQHCPGCLLVGSPLARSSGRGRAA